MRVAIWSVSSCTFVLADLVALENGEVTGTIEDPIGLHGGTD